MALDVEINGVNILTFLEAEDRSVCAEDKYSSRLLPVLMFPYLLIRGNSAMDFILHSWKAIIFLIKAVFRLI